MSAEKSTTKETKVSFATVGEKLTPTNLVPSIVSINNRFPHIDGENLNTIGELDATGLVIKNPGGEIVAGVRHPLWIPKEDGFLGGDQKTNHIERSFLINLPREKVTRHAQSILAGLEIAENLAEVAQWNEGFGGGGSEPESWLIDKDGNPYNIKDGGELQSNLLEQTIQPIADPKEFFRERAKQIIKRKKLYPDAIIVDTSTLMTSSPEQLSIAKEGEIGTYVDIIQDKLWTEHMHAYDPLARQLMNSLSKNFGYQDWQTMHQELGNMAYLVFAASHLSIGLPHLRNGIAAMAVPEQEAIAVADIFNTNLASLAEMLMLSTPAVFGIIPTVNIEGQEYQLRDVRAMMRYTLDTTYPSSFILTPERYRNRVTEMIIQGQTHTMDRAAYRAVIEDPATKEKVVKPVMHGRVRLRATSNEPLNQSGRIEFTGCSASPSILDEAARNSFLQILLVGAYEALAQGQHPVNYFKTEFPNLGRWEEQKDLVTEANLFGFQTNNVHELISEGVRFIDKMADKYSALQPQAELAKKRLLNLLEPAANSLEEYYQSPVGPFCEVIQNELKDHSVLEVAKRIEQYQLLVAQKIIESTPNIISN